MMFIVRADSTRVPPLDVRMVRQTPAEVAGSAGWIDFFCLGDPDAARVAGWVVVMLRDGWYADNHGGGVAIWGQGSFWNVRDTPFSETRAPRTWDADLLAGLASSAPAGLATANGETAVDTSRRPEHAAVPDDMEPTATH